MQIHHGVRERAIPSPHRRHSSVPGVMRVFRAPLRWIWLAVLGLLLVQTAQAAEQLYLDPTQDRIVLWSYIDVLEDTAGTLTNRDMLKPEIAEQFRPATQAGQLNYGLKQSVYWFRFTYLDRRPSGASPPPPDWIMSIGRHPQTVVKVFIPVQNGKNIRWVAQEFRDEGPSDPRQMGAAPYLHLPRVGSRPTACYIRVASDVSVFAFPEVFSSSGFFTYAKQRMLWMGLLIGIFVALILYNFSLFLSLQEKSYLWYVLMLACFVPYLLYLTGLSSVLVPFTNDQMGRIALGSLCLAFMACDFFTQSFLMTKRYAIWADKLLRAHMGFCAAVLLCSFFLDYAYLSFGCSVLGIAGLLLSVSSGISCWQRGFETASVFLLAWIVYLVSGVVYILTIRGALPFTGLGFQGFLVGTTTGTLVLSFGLADWLKSLHREREEARQSERRYMELAFTDSLTGLYNARYFWSQLALQMQMAKRHGAPLAILVMDVDNFKAFNDTFGHQEGDSVLSRMGKVMIASVRADDVPCRYGGEEFAVILPGSHYGQAMAVAERIRASVEHELFMPRSGEAVHVTVSIGVAEYIVGQKPSELVRLADKALYQAKAQGKNQVVCHKQEPSIA